MEIRWREYDAFGIALQKAAAICFGIFGGAAIERHYPASGHLFALAAMFAAIALTFLAFSRAKASSGSN
jgi:hypothetical protein